MLMLKTTHAALIDNLKRFHEMELQMTTRLHESERAGLNKEIELLKTELLRLQAKLKPTENNPQESLPLTEEEQGFSKDEIHKRVMMWTDFNSPASEWEGEGIKLWANAQEQVDGI